MNPLAHKILAGVVSGLMTGVVHDLGAWAKTPGRYDWNLAIRRWVRGAIYGAVIGAGIQLGPV